jgi:TIR domain
MLVTHKIHIFVSYTDADYHRGVDRLKYLLEGSEKPGYEVYSFRHDHPSPELEFGSNVQSALQKSQFVVVLWSGNAEKNPEYVLREIGLARKLNKPIVLVLLDDVKKPPSLFATEDGIRAFEHSMDWEGYVAQKLAVWVRHPPKPPVSYGASTAPRWLNGLKLVVCLGIAAGLGRHKVAEIVKTMAR